MSLWIEGIHQKTARRFSFIFLFTADSGVGEVYFVPELFSRHPFGTITNNSQSLGTIASGHNKTLMKFSQVMTEIGAGFFDEGIGRFVGTGVVDREKVSDDFFVGGCVAVLGVENELGAVGVVGRKSGEMVDEGAPCFFESGAIAYLFEVVPGSDNVVAVNEEYGFGSGGGFHGLQDRLEVMALGVMKVNRPYDDTVVSMLPQIISGFENGRCFSRAGSIYDRGVVWGRGARWGVGLYCGNDAV